MDSQQLQQVNITPDCQSEIQLDLGSISPTLWRKCSLSITPFCFTNNNTPSFILVCMARKYAQLLCSTLCVSRMGVGLLAQKLPVELTAGILKQVAFEGKSKWRFYIFAIKCNSAKNISVARKTFFMILVLPQTNSDFETPFLSPGSFLSRCNIKINLAKQQC